MHGGETRPGPRESLACSDDRGAALPDGQDAQGAGDRTAICRRRCGRPSYAGRKSARVRLELENRGPGLSSHSSQWPRSEEHTSELQSLMRISYAVFCLKKQHRRKKTRHSSKSKRSAGEKLT